LIIDSEQLTVNKSCKVAKLQSFRGSSLHPVISSSRHPFILSSLHLVILSFLIMACGGGRAVDTKVDSPLGTPDSTVVVVAEAGPPSPLVKPTATLKVDPIEIDPAQMVPQVTPLTPAQALPPQQLYFPKLEVVLDVTPMEWRFDPYDQERTRWSVPNSGVGWHPNSVGAGAMGNLLISGHQHEGEAPFAPLALDRVVAGDLVELLDTAQQRFIYKVITVSLPLPLKEMLPEVEAQVMEFVAKDFVAIGSGARLTLITGWPDFTTTHRRFVVAELVGMDTTTD